MRKTRGNLEILIFSGSILIRQRQKDETSNVFSEAGEGWPRRPSLRHFYIVAKSNQTDYVRVSTFYILFEALLKQSAR